MKKDSNINQAQALQQLPTSSPTATRRSKRCNQKVKTSHLRRIKELFWEDDTIYDDDSSQELESSDNDSASSSEASDHKPNRKRKRHISYGPRLQLNRIHDSPHIYTIDNFITESEIKHLQRKIYQAESKNMFYKSFVDKSENGSLEKSTEEEQRTSTFIHFSKLSDSHITSIENRAAELLSLPIHSIEPLQLVRYEVGEYFRDHHDLGCLFEDGSVELPKKSIFSPPRRIITVLVYLNDLERDSGGSTCFPLLTSSGDDGHSDNTTSDHEPLRIHPKRGMAVVWCNIKSDGSPDERLVHSGEPIRSCAAASHESISDNIKTSDCDTHAVKGLPIKYAMNIWACEE